MAAPQVNAQGDLAGSVWASAAVAHQRSPDPVIPQSHRSLQPRVPPAGEPGSCLWGIAAGGGSWGGLFPPFAQDASQGKNHKDLADENLDVYSQP